MRSHRPGPLPQNCPKRSAISAVTAERPAMMACKVWRETPSCRAASLTERLRSARTMSWNNSPGWVGGRLILSSVVLDEVDLVRFAVLPLEGNSPRSIDIHSPSHRFRAAIRMKPQAG